MPKHSWLGWGAFAGAIAIVAAGAAAPARAQDKLTLAVPAIPPVWGGVVAFVAKEAGFYKKYGVDVNVRAFESGAAAAGAVVSGEIEASYSPTAVVINMVSNAGVPLVAIGGLDNQDWLVASMNPAKAKCEDLKGQAVGVDSVNGARHTQLNIYLRSCNLKPEDAKPVSLSSNVGAAMIAGQLTYGVLHLDDIPVIEREAKKKLAVMGELFKINPGAHYLVLVANRNKLAEKRAALVKVLAAHVEAVRYMRDPNNADRVAKIAEVTGRSAADNLPALKEFNAMEFWPYEKDGLNKDSIDKTIATQVRVGGIKADKTPVTYEQLTDPSLWKDAYAMVPKM